MGDWYVIEPKEITNLISNPSGELNTDGWDALSGGTVAQDSTIQAVGLYSIKYTPTATTTDGIEHTLTLAANTLHTLSFSFQGGIGVDYKAEIYDTVAAAPLSPSLIFSGVGSLQRYQLPATTHATNTAYAVRIAKDSDSSVEPFYVDAIQLEAGVGSTYCDGDQDGCSWLAGSHSSQSFRPITSRAGGVETNFDDVNFTVTLVTNVGFPVRELIEDLPALGDGADHQAGFFRPRDFTLTGQIEGGGEYSDYLVSRFALEQLISPERVPDDQPILIRYKKFDRTIEIAARYKSGLEKSANMLGAVVEIVTLTFRAQEDVYWTIRLGVGMNQTEIDSGMIQHGAGGGAIEASFQDEITGVNYVIQNNSVSGEWDKMGTGFALPSSEPAYSEISAVFAVAVSLEGNVYIGGHYNDLMLGYLVLTIMVWDGATWTRLTTSDDEGIIWDLEFDSNNILYIAGEFAEIEGVTTSHAATYDGTFAALGSGLTSGGAGAQVVAIDSNDNAYYGGEFLGAVAVSNTRAFAMWDGTWNAVGGSGLHASATSVKDLHIDSNDNVFIGGEFPNAGGVSDTLNLAYWNQSAYSSIASGGANDVVMAITGSFGVLYVGGDFTTVGGVSVSGVTKKEGGVWLAMGGGIWSPSSPKLYAIKAYGEFAYFAGDFSTMDGISSKGIALWDNSYGEWQGLGGGVDDNQVWDVTIAYDGTVYLVGNFSGAGGASGTRCVAHWNGTEYEGLAWGAKDIVQGDDGKVYFCGGFESAGGVANTYGIAYWDKSLNTWNPCGTGATGVCFAMAKAPNGDIYAGGNFPSMGGVANTRGVAKLDVSAGVWVSIGNVSGTVLALAVAKSGDLYIAGLFSDAGGVANTKNMAKYNGSFVALSEQPDSFVSTLKFNAAGELYLGGAFDYIGGTSYDFIAVYSPLTDTFSLLDNGTNGYVNKIDISPNGEVLICGTFTKLGTVTALYVGAWNGSSFKTFGGGVNKPAYTLQSTTDGLFYMGGVFTVAGVLSLPDKLVIWTGANYVAASINLPGNAAITAILSTQQDLYVGFGTSGTAVVSGTN